MAGTQVPSPHRNSSPRQVPSAARGGWAERVSAFRCWDSSPPPPPPHIHPGKKRISGWAWESSEDTRPRHKMGRLKLREGEGLSQGHTALWQAKSGLKLRSPVSLSTLSPQRHPSRIVLWNLSSHYLMTSSFQQTLPQRSGCRDGGHRLLRAPPSSNSSRVQSRAEGQRRSLCGCVARRGGREPTAQGNPAQQGPSEEPGRSLEGWAGPGGREGWGGGSSLVYQGLRHWDQWVTAWARKAGVGGMTGRGASRRVTGTCEDPELRSLAAMWPHTLHVSPVLSPR